MKLEIKDRKLFNQNEVIEIDDLEFLEELIPGANGYVYKAYDDYLQRYVLVKFWVKRKERDKRDKIKQGIRESRKAAKASDARVVQVYKCGEIKGMFYSLMEFIDGVSVKNWLIEDSPSLARRIHLAKRIIEVNNELQYHGIVHGDLHLDNIIIIDEFRQERKRLGWAKMGEIDEFKVIDFGTSYFSNDEYSWKRHIKILVDTVNKICSPIKIQEAYGYDILNEEDFINDWESIYNWFINFFLSIRCVLIRLGVDEVDFDFDHVSYYDSFGDYWEYYSISEAIDEWLNEYEVFDLEDHLNLLINSNRLNVDYKAIGNTVEWNRIHTYVKMNN